MTQVLCNEHGWMGTLNLAIKNQQTGETKTVGSYCMLCVNHLLAKHLVNHAANRPPEPIMISFNNQN